MKPCIGCILRRLYESALGSATADVDTCTNKTVRVYVCVCMLAYNSGPGRAIASGPKWAAEWLVWYQQILRNLQSAPPTVMVVQIGMRQWWRGVGMCCLFTWSVGRETAATAASCCRLAVHSHHQMTWSLSLMCTVCQTLQRCTLQCFSECGLSWSRTISYDICGPRYRKVNPSTINTAILPNRYDH